MNSVGVEIEVADVGVLEHVARMIESAGQRLQIRGVAQRIDVDHRRLGFVDELTNQCGADEAGAARDQEAVCSSGDHLRAKHIGR
jgi:hypothetical protein